MRSRVTEHVVDQLRDLVDGQHLVKRAIESMTSYWREADPEVSFWAFAVEELRPRLGSQMVCVRSALPGLEAPYIATHLDLYVGDQRVGFYDLLTTLDGEDLQQGGGIIDDFFVDGRAAFLIERARQRTEGDPQEWIGMVDVKASPGNTLLSGNAAGGYATVLALASGESDYRQLVEAYFGRLGLKTASFDDVEPLADRLASQEVDNETIELAETLSESSPVACVSTIHTYGSDDSDEDPELT